jgi:UDP-N-acetyl-D-glucosamine dehydrogenase
MGNVEILREKIASRKAKVGVIGMGYVGDALAELVVKAGYDTIGFVRQEHKAQKISERKIPNLKGSTDTSKLFECDVILVCVQTPIHENKLPDLSYIEAATEQVRQNIREGQLIVIESSIAPGTTRKVALPILKKSGLKEGEDYFLSFSPERVDPGNPHFTLDQIPKVVAGIEENSLLVAKEFYATILKRVVPVSSLETAELVKILENTYRLVNISLVNEVAEYAKKINVDIWEVINAAATKPFGFMPHYPGPGIGGHCIPVDPYYLIDDARQRGIKLRLVEEAGKVNDTQPVRVVKKAINIMKKNAKRKKNKSVLLVGVSYKPDIDDPRESPALKIWRLFEEKGIKVSYHDPYISQVNGAKSIDLSSATLDEHDMIIITTNHTNIDYDMLANNQKPVLDTRNVYNGNATSYVFKL